MSNVYFNVVKILQKKLFRDTLWTGHYYIPFFTPISNKTGASFLVMSEAPEILETAFWCVLLSKFPLRQLNEKYEEEKKAHEENRLLEWETLDILPVKKVTELGQGKTKISLSKYGQYIESDYILNFEQETARRAQQPIWTLRGEIRIRLKDDSEPVVPVSARKSLARYKSIRG